MLLMLLFLSRLVHVAVACLQCDHSIRLMHEDFILSAPTVDQESLQYICNQTYVNYIESSQSRKGVIDPTTLYKAKTEYQSEFDFFLSTKHSSIYNVDIINEMQKGVKILEDHLDAFILDGLCPNKCGLLKRRVMDCVSCEYKMYICPSPSDQHDCGVFPVEAEEDDQAVLDCFLPWHRLVLGGPQYHFSWAPGEPGTIKPAEEDFKTLVVSQDSSVVLNQLDLDMQGTYRCSLLDQNGSILYQVTFPLTVTPLPLQSPQTIVTPPSLSDPSFREKDDLLVAVIAMVTGLSLAATVGLTLILGKMMLAHQRMAKITDQKWEEHAIDFSNI